MSLRMVRVETPRRVDSSVPLQSGRDWSRESRASRRAEVSSMWLFSRTIGNQTFLYGIYREVMNSETATDIRPFRVEISQEQLDDLQERLARTRLPEPVPGDDWDYGTPNSYLRDAIERWRTDFDWRAVEERMNAFPHFLTEIDGQTIH